MNHTILATSALMLMTVFLQSCCSTHGTSTSSKGFYPQSEGAYIGDVLHAPITSRSTRRGAVTIYVAFIDESPESPKQIECLPLFQPYDDRESQLNQSWLLGSLFSQQLTPERRALVFSSIYEVSPDKQKYQQDVIRTLEQTFHQYDINFTLRRPSNGDYTMIVVANRSSDLLDGRGKEETLSMWDPGNRYHNDVAFVFDFLWNVNATSYRIAHAVGHTLGLEDIDAPGDIMSLIGGLEISKRDEKRLHPFKASTNKNETSDPGDTLKTQNNHQRLAAVVPLKNLKPFVYDGVCREVGFGNGPARPVKDYTVNSNGTITFLAQGIVSQKKLWENGSHIKIGFLPNEGTDDLKNRVKEVSVEWTKYANIFFDFMDRVEDADVVIGFDATDNGWSKAGPVTRKAGEVTKTMNYSFTEKTDKSDTHQSILHEFGHCLGLKHEHQSPAASINWNKEEVYKYFEEKTPPWTRDYIDEHILNKLAKTDFNYSDFDPKSIMIYTIPASWTTDGYSVSTPQTLSEQDIEGIKSRYPTESFFTIETGVDCHRFDVKIKHSKWQGSSVDIIFQLGINDHNQQLTDFKAMSIPLRNNEARTIEIGGNYQLSEHTVMPNFQEIDEKRNIDFWVMSGGHRLKLPTTFELPKILEKGSEVIITWRVDRCD